MHVLSYTARDFFMTSSSQPIINKMFMKSSLWPDPLLNAIFSSTSQKDLKLGNYLDIDDRASLSTFGKSGDQV